MIYFAETDMQFIPSNTKRFLSAPLVSVIVVLLAVAARVFLQVHFFVTDDDKTYQIQAAQNFLNGHGLTIRQVLADDLSQTCFIPLVKWPAGYSFLLMPFLLLCGNDFFTAALLLDAVVAFSFVLLARKLLFQLSLPIYLINIYTLVSGVFIYESFTASTSDFITMTLYLAAISLTLAVIKSSQLKGWALFLIALLLFFTGFTRYMFIPVALVVPAYLAASGWVNRNRLLLRKGIVVFLLTISFITVFMILQRYYAGAATYVAPTEKGFYPESIARFHPFILSAFFNTNFVCTQLEKWTGLSFLTWAATLVWLHYLFLIAALLLFFRWLYKTKWRASALHEHYINIGAISSLAIAALLLFLSLTNAPVKTHAIYDWSFVQEGRYFAFAIFFVQQALFIVFFYYSASFQKWGRKIMLACFVMLSIGLLHGIYYTAKAALSARYSLFDRSKNMELMSYARDLLEKTRQEYAGKNMVVVSQQPFFNNYAALWYGIPGFYETRSFYDGHFQTKEETILFVAEKKATNPEGCPPGIERKIIGQIYDTYFYTIHVYPGSR